MRRLSKVRPRWLDAGQDRRSCSRAVRHCCDGKPQRAALQMQTFRDNVLPLGCSQEGFCPSRAPGRRGDVQEVPQQSRRAEMYLPTGTTKDTEYASQALHERQNLQNSGKKCYQNGGQRTLPAKGSIRAPSGLDRILKMMLPPALVVVGGYGGVTETVNIQHNTVIV